MSEQQHLLRITRSDDNAELVAQTSSGLFALLATGEPYRPFLGFDILIWELVELRPWRDRPWRVLDHILSATERDAVLQANTVLERWSSLGLNMERLAPAPSQPRIGPWPCPRCGSASHLVLGHPRDGGYSVQVQCSSSVLTLDMQDSLPGCDLVAQPVHSPVLSWALLGALETWQACEELGSLTPSERRFIERQRELARNAIAERVAALRRPKEA